MCHVSVYHVTCLFVCREVFCCFAGFAFELVKTKSKFVYLRKHRQMSAVTALQAMLQLLLTYVLSVNINTEHCLHKVLLSLYAKQTLTEGTVQLLPFLDTSDREGRMFRATV